MKTTQDIGTGAVEQASRLLSLQQPGSRDGRPTSKHKRNFASFGSAGNILRRAVVLAIALAAPLHAAEENTVETKLREALRDTMLKLRDAQGQIATAQAAQIAAEEKIKELTAKNESLNKDLIAERNTSTNMISELNTKLEERGTVITSLQAKVEKWKKSYSEITAFAAHKEAERAKYQDKSIKLERQVANQQVKNLEMYKAGMDTLNRYEKFGLGDAILAREPFVGTTKVKFENLIQDQADKLTDARIQPEKTETKPQAAGPQG
ncbi:MAG: hypothetical protein NTV93_12190 [Verrucomicrobia bacterium]|nr:hypothetical protein [Verrucomicrobiota bacterium]